ncbi:MAG: NYN domain-containing protein [bacterium]|nr:NYN domain-containing protein [bacterium]
MKTIEKNLLILDGYNMIHKWKEWRTLLEQGERKDVRMKFIDKIRDYTKKFPNLQTLIVFDGKFQKNFEWDQNSVKAIFSGEEYSADDKIIEFYKEQKRNYENIIVVTGDKKIFSKIETLGGISISSNDFKHKVELSPSDSISKNLKIDKYPNKREVRINLLNQL